MLVLSLPFAYLHTRAGVVGVKVFGGIMIGMSFQLFNTLFSHIGTLNTWPAPIDCGRACAGLSGGRVGRVAVGRSALGGFFGEDDGQARHGFVWSRRTGSALGASRSNGSRSCARAPAQRAGFAGVSRVDDAGSAYGDGADWLEGCDVVTVVPVFFGQGGHIRKDLPELIETCRAAHPSVAINCAVAVGEDEAVLDAVAEYCLRQAG